MEWRPPGRLRHREPGSYTAPVLGHRLVIVGDAHLGAAPTRSEGALLEFLEAIPSLGDCLLITGDLFDFWFAYRRAIPRRGFAVASALATLRHKVPIAMVGGNHDRWGDSFWDRECDIRFSGDSLQFQVDSWRVEALHGDGVAEVRWTPRMLHRITRHPLASAVFRSLPPDLGMGLVDRMSGQLADSTRSQEALNQAAAAQQHWAEEHLRDHANVDLLVMGHTHRATVSEINQGRWYVNPGAWLDGHQYAIASPDGIHLERFG